MAPTIDDETLARKIWADTKAQALGQAEVMGHVAGQKKLTPEEELLLWNTPADGWTPEQELALLLDGKSREEVGRQKFPKRQQLIEAGPRFLDKYEQAKYAAQMARKADPTWQPLPPPGPAPLPAAPATPATPTTEPLPSAGAPSYPLGG
jgi:hypothetical protein